MSDMSSDATTVSELVEALGRYGPEARVYTIAPSFDGVKVVPQSDGALLICPIRHENSATMKEKSAA